VTTAEQAEHWPTPRTITGGGESGERKAELGRTESGGGDLQAAVAMWPTPRSEDSESAGNHPGATDSLTGASSLWQTPASDSFRSRGGDRKDEQGLDQQSRYWGTPSSREWKGAYSEEALVRKDGKSRMDLLGNQAVYWQTPTAGDETKTSPRMREGHHNSLKAQVLSNSPFSRPDPETPTHGDESSQSAPTSRRQLNPRFVAWLMGWNPGWTSLEPLSSASPEMVSYPSVPASPFVPSGDNWPTPDTQNARSGGAMRVEAKGKHAMSLHHVVEGWSHEAP